MRRGPSFPIILAACVLLLAALLLFRQSAPPAADNGQEAREVRLRERTGTDGAAPRQRVRPLPEFPPTDGAANSVDEVHGWLREFSAAPEAAMSQILALEDPTKRDEMLGLLVGPWLEADPEGVRAWAESLLGGPDPVAADRMLAALLPAWAGHDPRQALQWVRERTAGGRRNAAESQIAEAWAAANPLELAEWMETEPTLPDFWRVELVHGLIPGHPEMAMAEADRLDGAKDLQETILRSWTLNDPAAAGAWVAGHPDFRNLLDGILAGQETPQP